MLNSTLVILPGHDPGCSGQRQKAGFYLGDSAWARRVQRGQEMTDRPLPRAIARVTTVKRQCLRSIVSNSGFFLAVRLLRPMAKRAEPATAAGDVAAAKRAASDIRGVVRRWPG